MTKDEASYHLSEKARVFIKSLGSAYVSEIRWRTMWAFVVQRLKNHNIVYGESIQKVSGDEKWPAPIHLRTAVKLMLEAYVKCNWDDSPISKRRREFCGKFEGYNHVCRCKCLRTFVEYDGDFLKFFGRSTFVGDT